MVTVKNQTGVVLEPIDITGGYKDEFDPGPNNRLGIGWGAGLLAIGSELSLNDVRVFQNTSATRGAGIAAQNTDLTINHSEISSNYTPNKGAGIFTKVFSDDLPTTYEGRGSLVLEHTTIKNNLADTQFGCGHVEEKFVIINYRRPVVLSLLVHNPIFHPIDPVAPADSGEHIYSEASATILNFADNIFKSPNGDRVDNCGVNIPAE